MPEQEIVENPFASEQALEAEEEVIETEIAPFLGETTKKTDLRPIVNYQNYYPDDTGEAGFDYLNPETGEPVSKPRQRRVMPDGTLGDADAWGNAAGSVRESFVVDEKGNSIREVDTETGEPLFKRDFPVGGQYGGTIYYTAKQGSDREFIDNINLWHKNDTIRFKNEQAAPPITTNTVSSATTETEVGMVEQIGNFIYNLVLDRDTYKFREGGEWDPAGFFKEYIMASGDIAYHPNSILMGEMGEAMELISPSVIPKGFLQEEGQGRRFPQLPPVGGEMLGPQPLQAALQELSEVSPEYLAMIGSALSTALKTPTILRMMATSAAFTGTFAATGTVIQQLAQVLINHPDRPKSLDEALARGGKEVMEQVAWEQGFRLMPFMTKFIPFNIRGRIAHEAKATQKVLNQLDPEMAAEGASRLTLGQLKGNQGMLAWVETFLGAGFLGRRIKKTKLLTTENLSASSRKVANGFIKGHKRIYGRTDESTMEFMQRLVNEEISVGKAWATAERQKLYDIMDGIRHKGRYILRGQNMKGVNVQEVYNMDSTLFNQIANRQKLTVNKEFFGVLRPAKPGTSKMKIMEGGPGGLAVKEVPAPGYGGPGIGPRGAEGTVPTGKEFAELTRQPRYMSLEDTVKFRTNLNSIIENAKGKPEVVGLSKIKQTLDAAIMKHLPNPRLQRHWEKTNEIYTEGFTLRDSVLDFLEQRAKSQDSLILLKMEPENMDKWLKIIKKGPLSQEMKKYGYDLRALDIWKSSALGEILDTSRQVKGMEGVKEVFEGTSLVEKLMGAGEIAAANSRTNMTKLLGKQEFNRIEQLYRATEFSQRTRKIAMQNALVFTQIPIFIGATVAIAQDPVTGWGSDSLDMAAKFVIFGPYAWGRIATSKTASKLLEQGMNAQRAGKLGLAFSIGTRLMNWDEKAIAAANDYFRKHQLEVERLKADPGWVEKFQERVKRDYPEGKNKPRHFLTSPAPPSNKDKRDTGPPMGLIPGIGG